MTILTKAKPTVGRTVHVVIKTPHGEQHRPAVIVNVFPSPDNRANMNPIYDHLNDGPDLPPTLGSVPQDQQEKKVGTWHWPEGTREAEE